MSRDIVIGASGLIGSHLLRALEVAGRPAVGTYLRNPAAGLIPLDLADSPAVDALLESEAPAHVYVPAANPNVEWIEENPEAAYAANVAPMLGLLERLRGSSARLVYYSTDYVFDGKSGPYDEDAETNPLNVYGRHKLEVERAIAAALTEYIIARVTIVYGWEKIGKNFVQRTVQNFRGGQTQMRAPIDQIGSPSYAPDVAAASVQLAVKAPSGLYNVAGNTLADRYEFACEIARVFDLPTDGIVPVQTSELRQKADRPLLAGLIVDKTQRYLDFPLRGYAQALRSMKESEPHYA